jgi:thiol-disulfide isomerase/thioredoxin
MKIFAWIFVLCMTLIVSSCKNQYLRGYFSKQEFIDSCQWKTKVNEKYKPDIRYLDSLKAIKNQVDVKLFLGTWCSDSRKLVPKFFAIQDNLPIGKLEIISVDTTKKDEKLWTKTMKVDSIPTFIFYRNEQEIGRLKVKPPKKTSLEKYIYQVIKER